MSFHSCATPGCTWDIRDPGPALCGLCREGTSQAIMAQRLARYEAALSLIAAPKRPDGTYNRSREACEQIARKALEET